MKANFIFIIFTTLIILGSCDKKNENSTNDGKIVFYTNAQAMLNCGSFNVDVYIGDDFVGSIAEPYVNKTKPEFVNSPSTLMIKRNTGRYTYTAKIDCGQYGEWHGEFEVLSDSCTQIFLDISGCNPKND